MSRELILASSNPGKIREMRDLLPDWNLRTAKEIGFVDPIDEPFDRFDLNAGVKAQTLHDATGKAVLAEDSGISVVALGGAPGVFSARYAGPGSTDGQNLDKLIQNMEGIEERQAWYTSVICLITASGDRHYFEGRCEGHLLTSAQGEGGFGYDPLFVPQGYEQSFGMLDPEVKKRISHRAQALKQLGHWIQENNWR